MTVTRVRGDRAFDPVERDIPIAGVGIDGARAAGDVDGAIAALGHHIGPDVLDIDPPITGLGDELDAGGHLHGEVGRGAAVQLHDPKAATVLPVGVASTAGMARADGNVVSGLHDLEHQCPTTRPHVRAFRVHLHMIRGARRHADVAVHIRDPQRRACWHHRGPIKGRRVDRVLRHERPRGEYAHHRPDNHRVAPHHDNSPIGRADEIVGRGRWFDPRAILDLPTGGSLRSFRRDGRSWAVIGRGNSSYWTTRP